MSLIARILAVLLVCQFALAQEVDDGDPLLNRPADRTYDLIQASGYLKVGLYENFPPYSWQEGGEPRGIDVDIGRRIAEAMGVEFRVHWITPDETLDDDLRNNVWKGHYLAKRRIADVMLRVPYDKKYAYMRDSTGEVINDQVVLFGPYQQEQWQIAFDADELEAVETIGIFQYHPIGVEIDTLPAIYLTSAFGGRLRNQTRHFPNMAAAFRAMARGEVKAVMGMRAEIDHQLVLHRGNNFQPAINGFPGMGKQVWDVGMAVKHTHRQLGYAIEAIVDQMVRSGDMAEIFDNHGLRYSMPGFYREISVTAPAWPDDPFGSPMWAYNIERYLGSDARVVHDDRVNLRVPEFAEDSAQVPLTVDLTAFPEAPGTIVAWVDLNPVPHLFSARPSPQPLTLLALNFRVQQATTVRVAVQDREGVWHIGSRYVEAAGGGCTAPSQTMSNPDWERHFGTIRGRAFSRAEGMRYKVNVMHPMDSGMVGNIPAFFIGEVELRQGAGQPLLLSMALSESAAENPMFVFEFGQRPPQATLWLRDNNGNQFERRLGGDL